MTSLAYQFISQGAVVVPEPGKVYIDVGNSLEPGIIDHHQPDAPKSCAAELVLAHPDYIRQQIINKEKTDKLTIVVHHYPDLDAVSGAWFGRCIALGQEITAAHRVWAAYVCSVDQGYTRLNSEHPVTVYSLFMMRMEQIRQQGYSGEARDNELLAKGFLFVETILAALATGKNLADTAWLEQVAEFQRERQQIKADYLCYQQDMQTADLTAVQLLRKDRQGREQVVGLWISQPESVLFKSWARGDTYRSGSEQGFIFSAIQLNPTRFILSVAPDSKVFLQGLGDLLEKRETEKRLAQGYVRTGNNRPGYSSPDPWYDGRSPAHNYTIIDSPRSGTVLTKAEIEAVFEEYISKG